MLIPQTAEYALRAVLHLARHDARPVRVPEMADAIAVPRNYLSKTLHQLARAGVLDSTRGPAGGFRLAVPAGALTLDRVIAVFAGTPERKCLLANRPCGRDPGCPVHARWAPVAERLAVFFGTTTVADLVGGASSPVGGRAEAVPADVPALLLPATRRETP
jgi:Rrf2 family protein